MALLIMSYYDAFGGALYMKNKFNDKAAIDMAYFRFSLIAPVIQDTFTDPTKTAYYRRVTESSFTLPNGKVMVYNPMSIG